MAILGLGRIAPDLQANATPTIATIRIRITSRTQLTLFRGVVVGEMDGEWPEMSAIITSAQKPLWQCQNETSKQHDTYGRDAVQRFLTMGTGVTQQALLPVHA